MIRQIRGGEKLGRIEEKPCTIGIGGFPRKCRAVRGMIRRDAVHAWF
jgi:hypothetical protein